MELKDKVVILSERYYKGTEEHRRFRCESGFGCSPQTIGGAIFGTFLHDGERCRVEGFEVEKLAEEDDEASV
jgi:hypothetical protein